jgi:hypothetical protein
MSTQSASLVPSEIVERSILLLCGQKVMLDSDLAKLYEVETKVLNQAVKRNRERFPEDFMYRLNAREIRALEAYFDTKTSRSQIVTLKDPRGHNVKYAPYAFTEQGVAMLSSVLKSKRAVQVNIAIIRAFVRLRELVASNKLLADRLNEMEQKYDKQFAIVFEVMRQLTEEPREPSESIGFNR